MKIKIEMGEDDYRLVGTSNGGEECEGDIVEYGLPAILDMEGERYMAYVEDPDADDEDLGQHVYKLTPVTAEEETVEEVEFDLPDEDGDEDEEGEEDGEGEESRDAA